MKIAEEFENGTIGALFSTRPANNIAYLPHKTFKGVYLKHLVTGKDTDGNISCHLVKLDPFCVLETHTHPKQMELHEVLQGNGTCQIAQNTIHYAPGTIGVIPQNAEHRVETGGEGLYILATFTPALL